VLGDAERQDAKLLRGETFGLVGGLWTTLESGSSTGTGYALLGHSPGKASGPEGDEAENVVRQGEQAGRAEDSVLATDIQTV
jgi:hypothetical protein